MRLLRLGAAIAIASVAVASACSSFEETRSETPDASADAPIEPRAEAAAPDAADAGAVVEAGFCPTGAFLCDDFERDAVNASPWGAYFGDLDAAADGATLTLDPTFFTSPTRSLRADPRGANQTAALTKFLPQPKRVDITFSLRPPTPGDAAPGASFIMTVEFKLGDGYINVMLDNGSLVLIEQLRTAVGGEYFVQEKAADVPGGTFTRYTLRVDRENKFFALLANDGRELSHRTLVQPHDPISRLAVGAPFTLGGSDPYWIDDVAVTVVP